MENEAATHALIMCVLISLFAAAILFWLLRELDGRDPPSFT